MHKDLVQAVLASPPMQVCSNLERERMLEYAGSIIDHQWILDAKGYRRTERLIGIGFIVGAAMVLLAQWRIDSSVFHEDYGWRTLFAPMLCAVYLALFLASLVFATDPVDSDVGDNQVAASAAQDGMSDSRWVVRQVRTKAGRVLVCVTVTATGALVLTFVSAGGFFGAFISVVLTIILLISGAVSGMLVNDIYERLSRSYLDPRDQLFADLIGMLAVAQGVGPADSAGEMRYVRPAFGRNTWAPHRAYGWRKSHRDRSHFGDMFEKSARKVEDRFHLIAPRAQGAARSEARMIGQRIAATQRSFNVALLIDTGKFESAISERLVSGIRSAARGDWKSLATTEPPAVATRLLRRYGRKWLVAILLIACAIGLPELLGKSFSAAFPQFRTVVASAALLLIFDTQTSAIKRLLEIVKVR